MKKQFSIEDFRLASMEEVSKYLGGHAILVSSPRGISTFVVYKFLKEHFGRPNCVPEMLVDVEEKIIWKYVLKGPRRFLSVYDWKLYTWSIGISLPWSRNCRNVGFEEITKYDEEARSDANILLGEIMEYAKTAEIPITEHSYQLIENTYKINYSYGEHFLQSLDQPMNASTLPELAQSFGHFEVFEDCCIAWAAVMSFVISVEAMFNILFEIYLKKEIREDEALRQHIIRLSLPDKWLLFASLCTCFAKQLDRRCRGYQSLKRLIGIRNSWAHATVSDEMRTFIIRKDKLMFATKRSPISKDIHPSISAVDYALVRRTKEDVAAIKLEILSAMKTNDKRKFAKALEQHNIVLSRKGTLSV